MSNEPEISSDPTTKQDLEELAIAMANFAARATGEIPVIDSESRQTD